MTSSQCVAPRSKACPGERCAHPAKPGSEWCGLHGKAGLRFVAPAPIVLVPADLHVPEKPTAAAQRIHRTWSRWIARRAGPLLRFREESNNPFDFYSSDPVAEIPLRYFISFVDTDRKGYIFDSRSVTSLLAHQSTNPFNRAPLPPHFMNRLARHGSVAKQETLQALTPAQAFSLEVTDTFRHFEDLGYYTDPAWFLGLNRMGLQRLYMELADIWYHRAMLSREDRARIVPPPAQGLPVPVSTVIVMTQKALEHTVIRACRSLVSSAIARSDRQLGVMYVLGSLSLVSPDAAFAYPWLVDMFAPGVTRVQTNPATGAQTIQVMHPAVLGY
jgi:hypothetical protein